MLFEEPAMRKLAAEFGVSHRIHPQDFMFQYLCDSNLSREQAIDYYLRDGHRSSKQVDELIRRFHENAQDRLAVLEFASGYGCVSRHLKKLSDRYKVLACDIHELAVEFLTEEIGVESVLSNRDPDRLQIIGEYDVVFALSFFSHMPHLTWGRWARRLFDLVNDGGLFIFTTHGRKVLPQLQCPAIEKEGYYFVSASEQKDLQPEEYGTMMVTPYYVLDQMRIPQDATLIFFQEAFWWEYQDTYVFQKSPTSVRASQPPSALTCARRSEQSKCHLDLINGLPSDAGEITPRVQNALRLEGWFVISAKDGIVADESWVALTSSDGQRRFYRGTQVSRPDVKQYLGHPDMRDPGFVVNIDLAGLNGPQKLDIFGISGGDGFECSLDRTVIVVSRG